MFLRPSGKKRRGCPKAASGGASAHADLRAALAGDHNRCYRRPERERANQPASIATAAPAATAISTDLTGSCWM